MFDTARRRTTFLTVVLTLALLFAASITSAATAPGRLVIKVKTGTAYKHRVWFGLVPIQATPQLAIWLADSEGRFVDTIYVTDRSAKQAWGNVRRAAALPVWSHQRGVRYPDGLYMPTKENPLPDAVSGATPKESFSREWMIPAGVQPGTYLLRVEVNNSFDDNETYREDLPQDDPHRSEDKSGQPSVVWEGRLEVGKGVATSSLKRVGHGHPAGKTGEVFTDLGGLTEALEIIEAIEVQVR